MNSQFQICRMFAFGLLVVISSGCVTFTRNAIPANRLPHQFEAPSKCNLHPINFAMLGGNHPSEHIVDSEDVLAITVLGVIPPDPKELPPIIAGQATLAREYYPPKGVVDTPSYGIPIHVETNGTIQLPLLPPLDVRGLTLQQVAAKIRESYLDAEIVKQGNDQVNVRLLRSRTNRILILREDASLQAANFVNAGQAVAHKRGSADVIDLPVYESDLLHALSISGGLPGVDAYNEVWILRKSMLNADSQSHLQQLIQSGMRPTEAIKQIPAHVDAVRIPLKLCPGEPIPFAPDDVLLNDGDVVYIEPRRDEYFYTGGLLPGRQIPLPRDEDIDVLEAIALAQGSVGGLAGTAGVPAVFTGFGGSNVLPPTRALILRKLPNGQQLPIRVNLAQATKHPGDRVRIMAGDYIMVYYKPGEAFANAALGIFNLNYTVIGDN